ncbi:Palmitoleoyl-protein carboxylesterase NOTUM [Chionoecetes opilio]|uniref:Palmitoleoyl-protein carboxylesterase NOTUM n=1 Tax=Chionoecetes opilio TaxID=41210 RepID=A0A8J4YWR8_CHIOP|nr:Palmitoleoyl-protein carboxylesterase NOTUM [Chionoecetes opilio]
MVSNAPPCLAPPAPLFVFQWVFDEAQMTVDNVGKPTSKQQWDYIHGTGERLRRTFQNVTALFAPSCIAHTVLAKRNWASVKIGDVSLPHALYCWDITPFANSPPESNTVQEEEEQTGRRRMNKNIRTLRRRAGEKSRRRRGRRRNKKSRRRSQGRAKTQEPQHKASNRTQVNGAAREDERETAVPQGKGVRKGSDSRDLGMLVEGGVTQEGGRLGSLGGEMLADSPKYPPQNSFALESNAINASHSGSTARIGHRRAERRKNGTRRRRHRGKKRSKNKEREKKLRKRDRRRKRKERRKMLQQKKRKKRKERRPGGRDRLRDSVRPVRSMPLSSPQPSPHPARHHSRALTQGTAAAPLSGPVGDAEGGEEALPEDAWLEDLCPARILHLTDRCAWPHCNYACPKLLNPFTGEEMNFTELLKSFGLDMASVASALGIDIHTLNSMGNDELLLILTQACPGFEPGTSCTQSRNHTPRPTGRLEFTCICQTYESTDIPVTAASNHTEVWCLAVLATVVTAALLPHHQDTQDNPNYDFQFGVKDSTSGNAYGHQESRVGLDTRGSYRVLLPDGRVQVVKYYVSGDSGFVAEVSYERPS